VDDAFTAMAAKAGKLKAVEMDWGLQWKA
jgi:hypothetical protein